MHSFSKIMILALATSFLAPLAGRAQLVEKFNPPAKAQCCLDWAAQHLAEQLQDWNQLGWFHDDDLRLESLSPVAARVVFMGDSITQGWDLNKFFPGKPYVNRGIGGEVTAQMLVRFFPDVIDLKPAAVIILAGTNDVAGNDGPETATMIEENLQAMTELAQTHHIQVILCSLTPVSDYTASPQSKNRPPADILKLNDWIKDYAAHAGAGFADYYSAIVDAQGFLINGDSDDGLHPNARGFALLSPVAEAAIEKAVQ
jgi:acyl-CoA thioesterase I